MWAVSSPSYYSLSLGMIGTLNDDDVCKEDQKLVGLTWEKEYTVW